MSTKNKEGRKVNKVKKKKATVNKPGKKLHAKKVKDAKAKKKAAKKVSTKLVAGGVPIVEPKESTVELPGGGTETAMIDSELDDSDVDEIASANGETVDEELDEDEGYF